MRAPAQAGCGGRSPDGGDSRLSLNGGVFAGAELEVAGAGPKS